MHVDVRHRLAAQRRLRAALMSSHARRVYLYKMKRVREYAQGRPESEQRMSCNY